MARRLTDPTTRGIRYLVLVFILAVVLPSLLLTSFGLIAISNEQAAASKRIKELYQPVLGKLGEIAESYLLELVDRSEEKLKSATDQTNASWGVNYFVIDDQENILWPSENSIDPARQIFMPQAYKDGLKEELTNRDYSKAVETYRQLLESESNSRHVRCLSLNALQRTLIRAGHMNEAENIVQRLIKECSQFVDSSGYNLSLGARLFLIENLMKSEPDKAYSNINELALSLSQAKVPAFPDQISFIAKRLAELSGAEKSSISDATSNRIEALVNQDAFLDACRNLPRTQNQKTSLYTVFYSGKRQVIVARQNDLLSGYQLLPQILDTVLDKSLLDMKLDDALKARTRLSGTGFPDKNQDGFLVGSLFLDKTQQAWRIDLALTESQAISNLASSRVSLYIWILVILISALIIGIGKTVQLILREAKLSRLKTDFVSSVSHELRTPLTSIRMFADTLLLNRTTSKEEERECLETIGSETERLSRLVERILDFSRMEAGRKAYHFAWLDVSNLVNNAISACRPIIENTKIEINSSIPDDLPQISADRDAIIEVLINLLSNAIKYSNENDKVEISARHENSKIVIAVRDYGIGIPRLEHSKIFKKFYRVDNHRTSQVSGSGLGLSLVDYIVRAHGGEMKVSSKPGDGSTFEIHLPSEAND
jgi:signal transduction histidine kinase